MSLGVEFLPVDMTQLVAVVLGCMIPLIFVLGITMRFAAKPLVDALVASRGEGARPNDLAALQTRIEALELEVRDLTGRTAAPALLEPRPIPLRP